MGRTFLRVALSAMIAGFATVSCISAVNAAGFGPAASSLPPGQVQGTATNDAAGAGKVGELLKSTVASGAAVVLTSPTSANVTSVSLTAGDWDVAGTVTFTGGATTTVAYGVCVISTTSAANPAFGVGDMNRTDIVPGATPFANDQLGCGVGPYRISLAATTTVYLVATLSFATSTASAFGTIRARRAR